MKPARLSVRFPALDVPEDLSPAIEVLHRFIQRGSVEGLVLDVADYRHVPRGPGVVLVGHDVDYGFSHDALTVLRKRHADDDAATQFRDALRMGLGALDALGYDGAFEATYDPTTLQVTAIDRRLGATSDVAAALQAELGPVVAELHGGDATVIAVVPADPREAPTVTVNAGSSDGPTLLGRLGGSRAHGQSAWDIKVEELVRLHNEEADFVLLDVREESEFETVNLGGRLIPLATLPDRLDELDADAHVVVHCRAGRRGGLAVQQLRAAGFTNVWNVNGGLMAWIDRVDPSLPRY